MLPILQIGPFALRTPLLLTLLGLYLGISLAERRLPKGSLSISQLNNLVFLGLGSGLIAARLFFALQHWSIFAQSPLSLLSLDAGLLDPWAGLTVGIFAILIYGQRQQLSLWASLDALTPLFAVLGVFLSLAWFASGAIYGMPTELPWGLELWGAKRHPVALYQAIAALIILIGFWRRWGKGDYPGQVFLQFTLATAASLLFVETWRAASPTLPGGLRTVQSVAWLVMALCFWLLDQRAKHAV
ncbi:MAG: prolipoprotein diacylglyceryl transferase [Anaerolineales bacterium]